MLDRCFFFFFFNDTATTEIYTLSLHDALPILQTAYLMAEIVAIPLTGWLTRMASTRGAFVVCVLGFTAASAACAAASELGWMIAARVVQGFCGGFLIPIPFSAGFGMFGGPARV